MKNEEYKPFLLERCPEKTCNTKLIIQKGKTDDVLKLVCPNENCRSKSLKRLQKGITSLKIRDVGDATIELLYKAGIESVLDLFDKTKMNPDNLCASGQFKRGRALDKIFESLNKIEQIPIDKAIHSLQLYYNEVSIGETLSKKIGELLSGIDTDFTGLSLEVREELKNENSDFYQLILNFIKQFEKIGIKIIREEKIKKVTETKKLQKTYDSTFDVPDIEKLNWNKVEISSDDCQLLITSDDNEVNEKIEIAKEKNIKILTYKKFKTVFL